MTHTAPPARGSVSLSVQSGPWTSVVIAASFPASSSVEALAPALVPVAVHHQADDDEEDAAQQGEEHHEENGNAAHPFFRLTHWKVINRTGGREQAEGETGE